MINPRANCGVTGASDGRLYVVGGRNPSDLSLNETVEVCDLQSGQCQFDGCINNSSLFAYIRCCPHGSGEELLVAGARGDDAKSIVQLYTPGSYVVREHWSVKEDMGWLYGMVHVTNHVVLLGFHNTVVCTMARGLVTCKVSHKYLAPNKGCAVVLGKDGDIFLIGGVSRHQFRVYHTVYGAKAQDVVTDTGKGWRPVKSDCSLSQCFINGYDTASLNTTLL